MTKREHAEYLRLEERIGEIGAQEERLKAEYEEIIERLRELDGDGD